MDSEARGRRRYALQGCADYLPGHICINNRIWLDITSTEWVNVTPIKPDEQVVCAFWKSQLISADAGES